MIRIRSVVAPASALALLVAALSAAPARAQIAAAPTPAADAVNAPQQQQASASGTDSEAIQEVVVTATKRNEDIQNVGMSITALTQADLEQKGVEQFIDYGTSIPNLSFGVGAADGSLASRGVYLRGIEGANTTGFYIDDTPVLETLDPHIVDVDRIEVLRGPQGTLYGAESMGGTVRIITAQPSTSGFSGEIHSSVSDTDHGSWNQLIEGSVNVPVSDTIAFRASGFYQYDSGWFDKWTGPDAEPVPGPPSISSTAAESAPGVPSQIQTDVGGMTYYGGQFAIRFQPIEGLSVTPRIMFQETDQDGVPYATYAPDNLLQREYFDIPEGGHDRWWLGSFTVNYTVPWGSFVSSTAVFDRRTFELEDDSDDLTYTLSAVTALPICPGGAAAPGCVGEVEGPITRAIGMHRFAQETRFASSLPGPIQFLVGGFYSFSTRPRNYEWTSPELSADTGWPTDLALAFIDQRETGEYAAFGDITYNILSNLSATVGLRWFRDTATFNQFTNGLFYGGASTYIVPTLDEKGFTPKYELDYKVTPDTLVYASAAKGFRPGGDNIELPVGPAPYGCTTDLDNLGVTPEQIATYRSDSLWDYEGGFKSSLLDRRFTLNATGFLIEWPNIQQLVDLPLCGYGYTGNSGKAQSTGAEVQFDGRLLPELTAGINFGYEDARITARGLGSPQPVGSPVQQVPGITLAGNLQYERHLSGEWSGFGRVDYSHVGESWSLNNAIADPVTGLATPVRRPAYNLTDLRGGVHNDRWEIAAFVKNLTNEHANLADAILIGATIPGQPRFEINQPRTAGVELRLRF
ncbi:MAG TPA: TonB-dependent receptor [Steroidobacteraceae bacterium]|nr:TonB-dependent receptor [Steroidobacteraceae bacterium]